MLKNEEKGFNHALFVTNTNGDIPSFSEQSKDQSQLEQECKECKEAVLNEIKESDHIIKYEDETFS
jgi:hypothetical protein